MPVAAGVRVSSGFGPRGNGVHRGIDFAAPLNSPIYAVADGVVVEGSERTDVAGFGCWAWIRHTINGEVIDSISGHMFPDGVLVKKGDRVKSGQIIARVGNNGDSSGPHLHFELWTAPGRVGGTAVDPAPWLGIA